MGYGSEHSMNLVLIGRFKSARDAEQLENLLGKLAKQAEKDETYTVSHADPDEQRFSDGMRALLDGSRLYSFRPDEVEQFASDHNVKRNDSTITIRTEEVDLSAFIKLFVDAGARVEVFSGHDYPSE